MVKPQNVSIEGITDEMVGRAHKAFEGSKAFYQVENSRGLRDADGYLIEYSVRYDARKGFTCGCEAGKFGFARCKDGICQHVKIAVAAAAEERSAVSELNRAIAEQAAPTTYYSDQDAATVARVMVACETPRKASKAAPYQAKGFSLLR